MEKNDVITACLTALQNLQTNRTEKPPKVTARMIVKEIEPNVKALLRSGISILSICDALGEAKIGISSRTFYNHITEIRKKIDNIQSKKNKKSKKGKGAVLSDSNSDKTVIREEAVKPEHKREEQVVEQVVMKEEKKVETQEDDFPMFDDAV